MKYRGPQKWLRVFRSKIGPFLLEIDDFCSKRVENEPSGVNRSKIEPSRSKIYPLRAVSSSKRVENDEKQVKKGILARFSEEKRPFLLQKTRYNTQHILSGI